MSRGQRRGANVHAVQARFEPWRQTRQGRTPVPDGLWAAAIQLARRDGVSRTAAALHLDGGKLKRRMREGAGDTAAPAAFVELVSPSRMSSGASLPEYLIELEGRHGTLRIHCKGTAAADLVGLSRALWDLAS